MYSICITFLIILHIQSRYPGVPQDAIAENKHVKEIVLRLAFCIFTLIYIFLQKKDLSSYEDIAVLI